MGVEIALEGVVVPDTGEGRDEVHRELKEGIL